MPASRHEMSNLSQSLDEIDNWGEMQRNPQEKKGLGNNKDNQPTQGRGGKLNWTLFKKPDRSLGSRG